MFSIPIVIGEGLEFAERLVKTGDNDLADEESNQESLDLSGMQCRWAKIQPPEPEFEVVSLLVFARKNQRDVFARVFSLIDEIYGTPAKRKPISIAKLKLTTAVARIGLEMKTRFAEVKPVYVIGAWLRTLMGFFYFRTKTGKKYLTKLVDMTDTLVVDGKINTVISGSIEQRERLENSLSDMEKRGDVVYGIHVSSESVMSCYVRNLNDRHVHFVDGAGGGYTQAAKMIKKKLAFISKPAATDN
jgi:hypothetical protein